MLIALQVVVVRRRSMSNVLWESQDGRRTGTHGYQCYPTSAAGCCRVVLLQLQLPQIQLQLVVVVDRTCHRTHGHQYFTVFAAGRLWVVVVVVVNYYNSYYNHTWQKSNLRGSSVFTSHKYYKIIVRSDDFMTLTSDLLTPKVATIKTSG